MDKLHFIFVIWMQYFFFMPSNCNKAVYNIHPWGPDNNVTIIESHTVRCEEDCPVMCTMNPRCGDVMMLKQAELIHCDLLSRGEPDSGPGRIFLNKARSCKDLYDNGYTTSGVYTLTVTHPETNQEADVEVYCDQDTEGGGWTVFQKRIDGSVNFYRGWNDYTNGFGDLDGEFWLGNEWLYLLTSTGTTQFRVELTSFEGEHRYAEYTDFSIGPSSDNFRLHISGYTGDAGDGFNIKHDNCQFSTYDDDNDYYSLNCAAMYLGGWWYNGCHDSNLNGQYGSLERGEGINWRQWKGHWYSYKHVEMKLRLQAL